MLIYYISEVYIMEVVNMTNNTTIPFVLSFINVSEDISEDQFLTVIFDTLNVEAGKEPEYGQE